ASAPVETGLAALRRGDRSFVGLVVIFGVGLGIGLLLLVYFNGRLFGRTKQAPPAPPKTLAMMIATGLGLHNLSEGLAIGQSAATGAVAFAVILVIGFALHNITEGFGIAAPLALDTTMPSWGFLLTAGDGVGTTARFSACVRNRPLPDVPRDLKTPSPTLPTRGRENRLAAVKLVFEHATLLDCAGRDPQPETRVVVEDGRIQRIGPD